MATVPKLNGMIRAASPLRVKVRLRDGTALDLEVTKQSTLQMVADRWPDRGETGLSVSEEGFLTYED